MRCPTLKELPSSPLDKKGWPWIEESPQLPDTMPDGSPWPRISIVTPSLNQGQFIEETIRSVLLQGYPDLEYIIIDGGSTDESVNIIKKYEKWLAYWISEPDKGQSDAINKGIGKCSGNIFAWINSDDLYLKSALSAVAGAYIKSSDSIIAGDVITFNENTAHITIVRQQRITLQNFIIFWNDPNGIIKTGMVWHQPGLFVPRKRLNEIGLLDESLAYAMDYDFFCRLLCVCNVAYIPSIVAKFRIHHASKTSGDYNRFIIEKVSVYQQYKNLLNHRDKADRSLTNDIIRRACYQFRQFKIHGAKHLFDASFSVSVKYSIIAIINELRRLLLGGRFTGRR